MAASRFVSGLRPIDLHPGTPIVRVHPLSRGPIFFGPSIGKPPGNRFDAPAGQYQTLYGAARIEGAFVETVLRRPVGRVLRRQAVEERGFSIIRPVRALKLAKIYDEGLQFHQIDVGEISTDDYRPSRALALALFSEFADLDGLAYRSRYNNGEICYAIFSRTSASDFAVEPVTSFVNVPDLVDHLMALHGAVFDTSSPIPSFR